MAIYLLEFSLNGFGGGFCHHVYVCFLDVCFFYHRFYLKGGLEILMAIFTCPDFCKNILLILISTI